MAQKPNSKTFGDRMSALLTMWKAEGVGIGQPSTPAAAEEFETRNSVLLTTDIKEYFFTANGMYPKASGDTDSRGFCFWPLQRVLSVFDQFKQSPAHKSAQLDPSLRAYFIFADYLQYSWAYAIRLGDSHEVKNEIVKVDEPQRLTRVAHSFSEFLDLYLSDSPRLYDPNGTAYSYRNE